MIQALQVYVLQGDFSCTAQLCELPAAQQLGTAAVAELLATAVTARPGGVHSSMCMSTLCNLPAAAQLTSGQTLQVLQASLLQGNCVCNWQLCELPAAQQLSPEAVSELLVAACNSSSEQGCCSNVFLRSLPAVQLLNRDQVMRVLQPAVHQVHGCCIPGLSKLPASAELSGGDVEELLQSAVQHADAVCIALLLQLPGAQEFCAWPSNEYETQVRAQWLQGLAGAEQHQREVFGKWLFKLHQQCKLQARRRCS
jgi:hypothetical protein